MTSEIIQDIYDKLSPSISLGLHKSPVPFSQQESLVCYTSKQSICSYFLLRNIFVFRQFKYESHPCSCIRQKDKYIISAPEPKHLVLIHTHTHTHTHTLSLSLSPMLFLDLSHPTKTDDAHFIILHSSIHISVNLCRPSDSFKWELNCCWPWLLQCQIYILWFHTKLREIIMELSIKDRNIPQLQWDLHKWLAWINYKGLAHTQYTHWQTGHVSKTYAAARVPCWKATFKCHLSCLDEGVRNLENEEAFIAVKIFKHP